MLTNSENSDRDTRLANALAGVLGLALTMPPKSANIAIMLVTWKELDFRLES